MLILTQSLRDGILRAVTEFRPDKEHPAFATEISKGCQCSVFQLTFKDQSQWAMRIPYGLDTQCAREFIDADVALLQELKSQGFKWSPTAIGKGVVLDGDDEYPFMLYEWIDGIPLVWHDASPPTRANRAKVIEQLARVLLSLISITGSYLTDSNSSLIDHLTQTIDKRIVRICRGDLEGFRVQDCIHHLRLLHSVVDHDLDSAPHFLGHGDLGQNNIIVDKDFNIACIIDWSFARRSHFQVAAALPGIFRRQGGLPVSAILQEDRQQFVDAFSRQVQEIDKLDVRNMLAKLYSDCELDHTTDVFEAIKSEEAFRELVDTGTAHLALDRATEDAEIEAFLERSIGRASGLTRSDFEKIR